MLDSIDSWVLQQSSLVDKRTRRLLPVVQQRQQIADALARYLVMLGLERRRTPRSIAQAIEEAPDLAPVETQDDADAPDAPEPDRDEQTAS